MKLLNLMGWLSIGCYIIGFGALIGLLIEVWKENWSYILICIAFISTGWLLHQATNRRESQIKRKQAEENEKLRKEHDETP